MTRTETRGPDELGGLGIAALLLAFGSGVERGDARLVRESRRILAERGVVVRIARRSTRRRATVGGAR